MFSISQQLRFLEALGSIAMGMGNRGCVTGMAFHKLSFTKEQSWENCLEATGWHHLDEHVSLCPRNPFLGDQKSPWILGGSWSGWLHRCLGWGCGRVLPGTAGALQNWVQPETILVFEQLTEWPQVTAFNSLEKGPLPKREKERGHYNCEVKIGHGSNHAPTWLTSPC